MSRYTNQTTHLLKGTILIEREKAMYFRIVSIDDEPLDEPTRTWFPLSQLADTIVRSPNADCDEIRASEWIMQQKELI